MKFTFSLLIVVIVVLCFRGRQDIVAQEPAAPERKIYVPFEGTEAFGHILHSFDLLPLAKVDQLGDAPPRQTLVIVFGNPKALGDIEKHVQSWDHFLTDGGSLLLVSDEPDGGRLAEWGLQLLALKVRQQAAASYRGLEECPLVAGFDDTHVLFKDLKKGLATNRPSMLRPLPEEEPAKGRRLTRLATFPRDAHIAWQGRIKGILGDHWLRVFPDAGYIFGPANDAPPGGRVVVIAGQGMFMNGMMIQEDNDNFNFAWNLVKWLSEGPDEARRQALFLEDGKAVASFGLPLGRTGPIPIPPVHVINQLLRGVENENLFNRALTEWVGKDRIVRVLLVAATIALFMLTGWRLLRGRFHRDHAATLLVSRMPGTPTPPASTPQARVAALLASDNLWEPAQALVRQFFLDHAGVCPPLWQAEDAAPPPSVQAAGSWWQRRSLEGRVGKLWRLVLRGPSQPVSPRQFRRLLVELAGLDSAAANKQLAFPKA